MKQRTWAVYILFILAIIAGILALLDAARYMGWLPISITTALGELKFTLPSAQWLGAILSAIVGVIWFVVAKWIWDLNESGRLFILVIAVVNLIILVLAILGQSTIQSVMLALIVNILALVLALLPSTEAAFRGR
jgi:hypothetical protein